MTRCHINNPDDCFGPCPCGEREYDPNPDGITPGQDSHVRMDPNTGVWDAPDPCPVYPLNGDGSWERAAARGECAWICADCCAVFPKGMPDACAHGVQRCTALIARDKAQGENRG